MNPIDLLRSSLFVLAHWFGGSFGAAIIGASVVLRIAMLPLTLPATRRRLVRERAMRALAPELQRLKDRYADKPDRLMGEMQKLYAAHGLSMLDGRALRDALFQLPAGALLYAAITRVGKEAGAFLWIQNLVSPDRALAVIAGALGAASAWLAARSPEASSASALMPLAVTGVIAYAFLSHISAGVALYSIMNSACATIEQAIVRRTLDRVET